MNNMKYFLVACAAQLCSLAAAADTETEPVHAAFQSKRGVQHKHPVISDDLIVGGIMIMFLMLFAFGEPPRALSHNHTTSHGTARHFAGSRVHRLSTAHRPSSSSSSSQLSSLSLPLAPHAPHAANNNKQRTTALASRQTHRRLCAGICTQAGD